MIDAVIARSPNRILPMVMFVGCAMNKKNLPQETWTWLDAARPKTDGSLGET